MQTCCTLSCYISKSVQLAKSFFKKFLEVGPAMEDALDLEGVCQEPEDYGAANRLWAFLEPRDRLSLLLVSWYLRTGIRRLFIWAAVHRGF